MGAEIAGVEPGGLPSGMMAVTGLTFDAARIVKVDASKPHELTQAQKDILSPLVELSADFARVTGFDTTIAEQIEAQSAPETPTDVPPADAGAPAQVPVGTQSLSEANNELITVMTLPSGKAQPQERLFASDALVAILPHLQEPELLRLTRTVSRLDVVSDKLRSSLVRHSNKDISCRMLKGPQHIPDTDLLAVLPSASEQQLRLIARRWHLPASVCEGVIASANATAILDLLRNSKCELSDAAFSALAELAEGNEAISSALCNRDDLPQSAALRLFWQVDGNLRRFLLSRFLVESASLGRVIEIGIASGAIPPLRDKISAPEFERLVALLETGDEGAVAHLAKVCRVAPETAALIVSDAGGEPLAVVCKALAQSRLTTAETLKRLVASPNHPLSDPNRIIELHALFDSLSHNKSRMLLSYWDWAARDAGPYVGYQA